MGATFCKGEDVAGGCTFNVYECPVLSGTLAEDTQHSDRATQEDVRLDEKPTAPLQVSRPAGTTFDMRIKRSNIDEDFGVQLGVTNGSKIRQIVIKAIQEDKTVHRLNQELLARGSTDFLCAGLHIVRANGEEDVDAIIREIQGSTDVTFTLLRKTPDAALN
uniref:Uncharacterized protein n=1 Tax=Noctiluca scintillans TaxID=2966 RepID=A0A7S1EZU9_NOCSC